MDTIIMHKRSSEPAHRFFRKLTPIEIEKRIGVFAKKCLPYEPLFF